MQDTRTANQRLATLLLEESVEGWIQRHRADDRTWSWIARKLEDATGGQVKVVPETIRLWAHAAGVAA